MNSETKHDARKGFHDIKPLFEGPAPFPFAILLALAGLMLLGFLLLRRKKKKVVIASRPYRDFRKDLNEIKESLTKGGLSLRAGATAASEIVRAAIEVNIKCPALEMTPKELSKELSKSALLGDSIKYEIVEVIRGCERIGYSDDEPEQLEIVLSKINRCDSVLEEIAKLNKEAA